MLSDNNSVARPYRLSTLRVLLLLLFVAFLVNSLAALLVIQDYYLLNDWLAHPDPLPSSQILALRQQIVLRFVSRLAISAVLILCALVFVWQRRRSVSIHGALHRVERLAQNVLESMVQGVIVVDGQGVVMDINPAALRLLCPAPPDQTGLIGRPIGELPAAGPELAELAEEAATRGEPAWDRSLTIEQGGLARRLRADAQALQDASGRSSGCIILLRDMTLTLLAEDRMRRLERIAGLGDAANGLVHEIKNPLTALSIHLQLLEEQLADPRATAPVGELFAVLNAEADRLNNVLDGFRDYAQLQRLSVQPTDAVRVLERVVHLIGPQAERQGVRLALRRPPAELPKVPLDAEKVEQAVLNLTINALEAMPNGGDLAIEVDADADVLSVVVRDTGPGIPDEIRPHIFKPYFSTKLRGTGLGLALTEKLVGQHRGGIECRSGPGGTSFHVAFPLAVRERTESPMDENCFRILIVDDEPSIRAGLSRALSCDTYELSTASDVAEALNVLRTQPPHLILLDLKMPGPLSGLDLIRHAKDERPEILLIVITAHGSIETAVEAMRLGAQDYVTKPVNLAALRIQVHRAFEHHQLREENRRLRDRLAASGPLTEIIGQSAVITELLGRVVQIADTDVSVMIEGESGTGKGRIACALHDMSSRRHGPFILANIEVLPESLIDSELFGYESRAFNGAAREKAGWLELAGGGTLFLNEVGELPLKTQVDLLRVLEHREFHRLGGKERIPLDVRLVVATNRDIDELVAEGQMRSDLYYRFSVVRLRLPPLRERRDDIPHLIRHFIERAALRHNREIKQVAGSAMRVIREYAWPGNLRQLRNIIERLVVTVERPTIQVERLAPRAARRASYHRGRHPGRRGP